MRRCPPEWKLGHNCSPLRWEVSGWQLRQEPQKLNLSCSVNPDELLLRMGEFDLNDEEHEPFTFQDRKVQIVASHPKFDPKTFEYDLALLRYVPGPNWQCGWKLLLQVLRTGGFHAEYHPSVHSGRRRGPGGARCLGDWLGAIVRR